MPSTETKTSGSVLGVDVGFSSRARTTCFCLLRWTESIAALTFSLAGVETDERRQRLRELLKQNLGLDLDGAAIDGPLTHGLRRITHYRAAEALLSRGVLQFRGKPGQTSSPTGLMLHRHATELAEVVLSETVLACSKHYQAIHEKCLVEAFPNMFLAALIPEANFPGLNRDASDRYWEVAVGSTLLEHLLKVLLPGRRLTYGLAECGNHEHRAGVVCALTALSVSVGRHIGVGDSADGDIILPPQSTWGIDRNLSGSWMEAALRTNIGPVRLNRKSHPNHKAARVVTDSAISF
jgi:predicted nuclease with RNAse H fold